MREEESRNEMKVKHTESRKEMTEARPGRSHYAFIIIIIRDDMFPTIASTMRDVQNKSRYS